MAERPTYLLDSDICIYLLRGSSQQLVTKVAAQPAGTLLMSSISLAEIALGYGERAFNAPELASFRSEIRVVDFDEKAAMIYAVLPFRRSSFDRLIAAHALSLGCTLVTNNEADFEAVPGLRFENWA